MPTQRQIEDAAGIDKATALYIMTSHTVAAKTAMSALKLCVARFEQGAFGILAAAVDECKAEMTEQASWPWG